MFKSYINSYAYVKENDYLLARDISSLTILSQKLRILFKKYVIFTPGLFRTNYGIENNCMLHQHQNVSLRWMKKVENYTDVFGALRGGVLADAPGLGKTVTMIALIASTAGQLPVEPVAFWDMKQLEDCWKEKGGSCEGNYRCVEKCLRQLIKSSEFKYFPHQLTAEYIYKRFQHGDFPTLTSFEIAIRQTIRQVSAGDPSHAEMLRHSFRRNMLIGINLFDSHHQTSPNSKNSR